MSEPVQIILRMTEEDFEQLTDESAKWSEARDVWDGQRGRFENVGRGHDRDFHPQLNWTYAYWVGATGGQYTALLFAKAFLEAQAVKYEVAYDLAGDGQYVILTDYASLAWQRARHNGAEGEGS